MDRFTPLRSPTAHFGARVPFAVVAFALLSVLDLGFSKMAFFVGYGEANPILRATLDAGTFEATKIMLTLLVTVVGTALWQIKTVRGVMWIASVGMSVLSIFHVYGLLSHIAR